jgi:hypothetical protein
MPNVQVQSVYYGQAWGSTTPPPVTKPGVAPAFNAIQDMNELDTFLGMITQSGFMDQLNQYGVGRGSFFDRDVPANGPTAGTTISESQITNMLNAEIASNRLLAPSGNRLYVVFLPPNVHDQNDLSGKAVGHHNSFTDSAGQTVYYAVILHPTGNLVYLGSTGKETPFQYQTETLSHELAEAVTDPGVGSGWWDRNPQSPTFQDEIGDIPQQTLPAGGNCVGNYQGYLVTELWSNQAGASVLPPSGVANLTPGAGWVSSITTVTGTDGFGYIFGIGSDKSVWIKAQQFVGYTGWSSLGGGVTYLTATTDANGWRLFAIAPNGAAFTRGEQESGWTLLGGNCLQLATGHDASGRLDLFAIGTDHRVYEMVGTGSGTTGFRGASWARVNVSQGDQTVQQIVVASNSKGEQQVFGISSQNNSIWTIAQTAPNAGWGAWANLGGWVSQLAVGSTSSGLGELFGIGKNHALYIKRQTSPTSWSGASWVSLGGNVQQIAVGRNMDGREEVFAIGADNSVWALMQAAASDAWTDSGWFQVTKDKVKELAVVYDSAASLNFGEMTLAMIQSDNSLTLAQQTSDNGGWY